MRVVLQICWLAEWLDHTQGYIRQYDAGEELETTLEYSQVS